MKSRITTEALRIGTWVEFGLLDTRNLSLSIDYTAVAAPPG